MFADRLESVLEHRLQPNEEWFRLRASDAPCQESATPIGSSCFLQHMRSMFHSHMVLTAAEEKRNPTLSALYKGKAQKHQPKHTKRKMLFLLELMEKAEANGNRNSEAKQTLFAILEWWILFQLGSYRHASSVCSNPIRRLSLTRMWRTRFNEHSLRERLEQILTTNLLLFAIKEHLLFIVRNTFAVYAWCCLYTKWNIFESHVLRCIDAWRREPCARTEAQLRQLMKQMNTMKWFTDKKFDVWEYLRRQMKNKPVAVSPDHFIQNDTDFIQLVSGSFHRRSELLRCPDPPHTSTSTDTFLTTDYIANWRFVRAWMRYARCSDETVDFAGKLVDLYYQTHEGRNAAVKSLKSLHAVDPYAYRILSLILQAWQDHQNIRIYDMPATIRDAHVRAIAYRYAGMEDAPDQDALMFCPICRDIKSLVVDARAKDVLKRCGTSRSMDGFDNIMVDEQTMDCRCGRKNGQLRKLCNQTILPIIPLTGKMVVLYHRVYTICPQPTCAHLVALNRATDDYNEYGFRCYACIQQSIRLNELLTKTNNEQCERKVKEEKELAYFEGITNGTIKCTLTAREMTRLNRSTRHLKTEKSLQKAYEGAISNKRMKAVRAKHRIIRRHQRNRDRREGVTNIQPPSAPVDAQPNADMPDRPELSDLLQNVLEERRRL